VDVAIQLNGLRAATGKARVITLANASADAENTLERLDVVAPRTGEFTGVGPSFTCTLEPNSLTTLRIPEK